MMDTDTDTDTDTSTGIYEGLTMYEHGLDTVYLDQVELIPGVVLRDSCAMFVLCMRDGADGSPPVLVPMKFEDALALAEGIVRHVEHATENYFLMLATKASSNIKHMAYCARTAVLRVVFSNKSSWDYFGVPTTVVHAVMEAPSLGRAFNTLVKNNESDYPRKESANVGV